MTFSCGLVPKDGSKTRARHHEYLVIELEGATREKGGSRGYSDNTLFERKVSRRANRINNVTVAVARHNYLQRRPYRAF